MAERNAEREQWKKDFTDRVFDRLINPLTVMELSLEKLKEVRFEGGAAVQYKNPSCPQTKPAKTIGGNSLC